MVGRYHLNDKEIRQNLEMEDTVMILVGNKS
jgi:hypothetical protein